MSSEDLTKIVPVSHNILDEVTSTQRRSQNSWSKKLPIKFTQGLFEKWLSRAGAECLTPIVAIKRRDKEKEGQKNEEGA